MAELSPRDLEEIKRAHSCDVRYIPGHEPEGPWCNNRYETWPCTPALLIARFEELERDLRAVRREYREDWQNLQAHRWGQELDALAAGLEGEDG